MDSAVRGVTTIEAEEAVASSLILHVKINFFSMNHDTVAAAFHRLWSATPDQAISSIRVRTNLALISNRVARSKSRPKHGSKESQK